MKLVVYSNKNLETQTKWVKDLFSAVPNKNVLRPQYLHPFPVTQLKKFWQFVPSEDKDKLEVVWILEENMIDHYKTKPERYLSFLFGHEGPNSLLSILIDEGLATELCASAENELLTLSALRVSIKLTKKGLAQYKDVVEWVFSYLRLLQIHGKIFYI